MSINYQLLANGNLSCPNINKVWNNCNGTYIWENGDKYVGEWKNDKYHGQGTFTWENGDKYVGEWKNNKRHGKGKLIKKYANVVLKGIFINSSLYSIDMVDIYDENKPSFWIGVTIKNIKPENMPKLFSKVGYSVLVEDIAINGPSYNSGLKKGDVIIKLNDFNVKTSKDMATILLNSSENIIVTVKRSKSSNKEYSTKVITLKPFRNIAFKVPDNKYSSKSKNINPSISSAELEKEKAKRVEEERKNKILKQRIAELEKKNIELSKPKKIKQKPSKEIGSGFFVSKFRHIVTNQHVVNQCKKITVGNSMSAQIPADLIVSDKRNDLAILQTISLEMASADTKSFVQSLAIQIVPIISGGLMRSEDVRGGEDIIVAGYPFGDMVSDTIKVTKGIVSATKGMNNDVSQFEIDAVIRKGNSGGPIYDRRGNIVGVAVSRLNVNRNEYLNFGIKGSTVKQFLSVHDIPTKWSNREKDIRSEELYKLAFKQTVMVVCHR